MELWAPHQNLQLKDHPLSAAHDCLLKTVVSTPNPIPAANLLQPQPDNAAWHGNKWPN
jgi:hypothetical protein